jgi:hypothetical protein
MNTKVVNGTFHSMKIYRSKNGSHHFTFKFVGRISHIDVFCTKHPSFKGKSSNPHKTHLYHSGKVCFIAGREPKTQKRAEELAAQWAEYFLEYRRTGKVQH